MFGRVLRILPRFVLGNCRYSTTKIGLIVRTFVRVFWIGNIKSFHHLSQHTDVVVLGRVDNLSTWLWSRALILAGVGSLSTTLVLGDVLGSTQETNTTQIGLWLSKGFERAK